MPKLSPQECYRVIAAIDIEPVLRELGGLKFEHVNENRPGKYPQDVILWQAFPDRLRAFAENLGLGGHLGRALLRKLPAGGRITPHIDAWMPQEIDWRRFQLPIVTHPDVLMRWPDDGVEVHLLPGVLYEVRYDRTHEVVNASPVDRVHLQIDQVNATA